ncbi:EexN family lipoprotein [Ralstonia pseudosolanacearum]
MTRAAVLFAFMLILAGCGRPQDESVDALTADPMRLDVLRAQCRRDDHDTALCAKAARADLRRFLSGRVGPHEYQTLADLPPIPTSFDGPIPKEAQP